MENKNVVLEPVEQVELSYLWLKGFRWLARNEIGTVVAYKGKPHRDKETNYEPYGRTRGGYDFWIETKTPLSAEARLRVRHTDFGKYEFLTWEDEPMFISGLIDVTPFT